MPIPIFSLIIPTKDRESIFFQTLKNAYRAINGIDAEIIVINDSKKSDLLIPMEYSKKITCYNNPKSGVASARNLGAKYAKSTLLLFIDDDIIIAKENIDSILTLARQYPDSCFNSNFVYPPELVQTIEQSQFGRYLIHFGFTTIKGWNRGNKNWNDNKMFESLLASYFLLIPKKIFERVSGYNESFPYAGFEDYDFGIRLQENGIKCFIEPTIIVFHNEEDRITLKSWMERKVRGGITRRTAVKQGHQNLALNYSVIKKMVYQFLLVIKPLLFRFIHFIPNSRIFDFIYFRIVNLLLGISIFEGYNLQEKNNAG